jgi:hypothetical protein
LCPKLVAHLLDLGCLRFEGCLKLRNGCFQFLHLAMLLQELIEQHRVHRFIADGVGPALLVTSDQVGIVVRRCNSAVRLSTSRSNPPL